MASLIIKSNQIYTKIPILSFFIYVVFKILIDEPLGKTIILLIE